MPQAGSHPHFALQALPGVVLHSAREAVDAEASIMAAAHAVYFLNKSVHLLSITVLLQTVTIL